jgi:hypothetical protein
MKIAEILENAENYFGQTVKVEGFLMAVYNYTYIAPNIENFGKFSKSIKIADPEFMEKVRFSDAPPAGGGVSSYPYDVVVEGKLLKTDDPSFPLALKNIKSACLESEEDVFQVDFGNLPQE